MNIEKLTAPGIDQEVQSKSGKGSEMMDAKDWRAVRIEQLEAENTSLKAELAAAQAKIDSLMLEYCPNEMTKEQTAEWARNQRPAPDPFLDRADKIAEIDKNEDVFGRLPEYR